MYTSLFPSMNMVQCVSTQKIRSTTGRYVDGLFIESLSVDISAQTAFVRTRSGPTLWKASKQTDMKVWTNNRCCNTWRRYVVKLYRFTATVSLCSFLMRLKAGQSADAWIILAFQKQLSSVDCVDVKHEPRENEAQPLHPSIKKRATSDRISFFLANIVENYRNDLHLTLVTSYVWGFVGVHFLIQFISAHFITLFLKL